MGAGAGMICFDWKAGIGTSSRLSAEERRDARCARACELRLRRGPARRQAIARGRGARKRARPPPPPGGSCIAVVATDLPLGSHDLSRVARRCGLGLARTGSVAHHGSGEIFIAVSTAAGAARRLDAHALDQAFEATVDATEEAVLNALWAAVDTVGREGRLVRALPHEPVLALLERHGLLEG